MQQGSRTKLVAALVLASVFGSGILLGYAADNGDVAFAAGQPESSSGDSASEAPRRRREPVWAKMRPSVEQRLRIDSIMGVHRERMNTLHAEFDVQQAAYQASYDAIIHDTREAIAGVFPLREAIEYRRLLAEDDRVRAERRANREDQKQ